MPATVSLRQVSKRFGAKTIVANANLEVAAGEFIVMVGPSGCGKSTTLRMVAGLEEISDGEVRIADRVVNQLAPKDRAVAMVFQNYALYPHLSVRDNISFGLRLTRMPKAEIAAAVARAAQILELEPLLERKPSELSGGQRQRVAMGRAIVRDPAVFLFDEPLSNLDAKLRTQMRAEIKRLHKRLGTTILYVTHDQVEAMTLADRIVVMRDGRIEQVGTPMALYQQPASTFVAAFMGSPPMNLHRCAVLRDADGAHAQLGEGQRLRLPDGAAPAADRVTLGLRPEQISLQAQPGALRLRGEVEPVEPLGAEAIVHLRVGDAALLARVPGMALHEIGEALDLHIAPAALHLFDADSGAALAAPEPRAAA